MTLYFRDRGTAMLRIRLPKDTVVLNILPQRAKKSSLDRKSAQEQSL